MTEWKTVQNVVFPLDRDPDVLPLYLDPDTWTTINGSAVRVTSAAHIENVISRSSARIPAGKRVSFASYFNAFPASYWQHWTNVSSVLLSVNTSGKGTVLVYRSSAQGIAQRVASHEVDNDSLTEVELPVTAFGDGGWYWFDVEAGDNEVVLDRSDWAVDVPPVRSGKVSLAITTFNKADYCVRTLETLASSQELLGEVDRIFVIDQGTKKVADEPGFDEVAGELGEQLQVIVQPNLGGSGGFSRGMAETLERPESDFVLLLDDDVKVEPESILRALHFGRHSRSATIVGGHMFDLLNRTVLHAFSEVIDLNPFVWHASNKEAVPHDFAASNLRQTPWMHTRMDADYNGWWFCMIPTEIVREVGLSLPAFIKWDDAEYCLRARSHGYSTMSLPGAALWHISWLDKDDTLDWQAYFHARNRTVAALVHSPYSDGGAFTKDSGRWDLKHLLSMQYYPVELRLRALRDVLSGPEHLHASLGSILGELNARAKDFPEKRVLRTDDETPKSQRGKQTYPIPKGTQVAKGPRGLSLIAFTAKAVLHHWTTTPSAANVARPEVELAKRDATWFHTPLFDSALISTADGTGKNWYVRDPKTFRRMLRESCRLHRRLRREWGTLATQYREAMPTVTSVEEWRKTFTR